MDAVFTQPLERLRVIYEEAGWRLGLSAAHGAASQEVLASVRTADQRDLDATAVLVSLLTAARPTVAPTLGPAPH